MSIMQVGNKVVPIGAKAYALTIAEPSSQWYSAAISSSGTAKTYGSWVQLVSSTSEDILLWWIALTVPQWGGQDWSVLSIGTGAAASEVEVLSLPFRNQTGTISQVYAAHPPMHRGRQFHRVQRI